MTSGRSEEHPGDTMTSGRPEKHPGRRFLQLQTGLAHTRRPLETWEACTTRLPTDLYHSGHVASLWPVSRYDFRARDAAMT